MEVGGGGGGGEWGGDWRSGEVRGKDGEGILKLKLTSFVAR